MEDGKRMSDVPIHFLPSRYQPLIKLENASPAENA